MRSLFTSILVYVQICAVCLNLIVIDTLWSHDELQIRSVVAALGLGTLAVANYACGALVIVVQSVTSHGGRKSGWIANNINESRLDLFFWCGVNDRVLNTVAQAHLLASVCEYALPRECEAVEW